MPYVTVQRVLDVFRISWRSLDTNIKRGTVGIPLAKIQHADVLEGLLKDANTQLRHLYTVTALEKAQFGLWKPVLNTRQPGFHFCFLVFFVVLRDIYLYIYSCSVGDTVECEGFLCGGAAAPRPQLCKMRGCRGRTWHTALESLFVLRALVFCPPHFLSRRKVNREAIILSTWRIPCTLPAKRAQVCCR